MSRSGATAFQTCRNFYFPDLSRYFKKDSQVKHLSMPREWAHEVDQYELWHLQPIFTSLCLGRLILDTYSLILFRLASCVWSRALERD